ncbi:hypothetical protein HHX47_DHR9000547 [Lentinula edodes]|nr:hypothetical protein HHX47_DHR9000547 [Lentinula edodes]
MPSFNTFQFVFFLCFGHLSGVFTAPVPRWNGNHHWSSSGSSDGAPVTIVSVSQGPALTLGTGSTTVVGSSTYTVSPAPTATTTTSWDFNGAPVTVVSVFSGPVLTLGPTGSTTTVNGATYTVAPSSISVSMSTSWGASGAVTMMSASGGPELTLAASGQTTTVGSSTYTVVPTSVASSSVSVSTSTSWGPSGAVTMISASGGPDLTLASTGATTTIGTSVYTVISPSAPSVSTSTSWGPCYLMPVLGFGVYQNYDARTSCLEAFKAGYRHVDSAQMYRNEAAVGEAVRESGINRSDLFISETPVKI